MTVQIGDTFQIERSRRPFSGEITAAWYIATVGHQRREMLAAAAWLVQVGAQEAWWPETSERRQIRRGHRVFREIVNVPVVPGLLFILTDLAPQWDLIADRRRIRPMRIGDRPVAVTEGVMAKMEAVPQRIESLRQAAIEADRAAREALIPKLGDAVAFFGTRALVEDISPRGFLVTISGKKIWLPPDTQKAIP